MGRLTQFLQDFGQNFAAGGPAARQQLDLQAAEQARLARSAGLREQVTLAQLAGLEQQQTQATQEQGRLNALAQQFGPQGFPQQFGQQGPPALPRQGVGSLRQELIRQGDIAGAAKLGQPQAIQPLVKVLDPATGRLTFRTREQALGQPAPAAVGRTQFDVPLGAPGKKEREESGAAARAAAGDIASTSRLLKQIQSTSGAFGFRGEITESVGGLVGQVSPGAERALSQAVSGASPGEVASARTTMGLNVSRSLGEVTGDTSGRYTEKEREIADEILRTNTLASQAQRESATSTLLKIQTLSQDRNSINAGVPIRIDLNTPEGVQAMGENLMSQGLSAEDALDLIEDMADQRERLFNLGVPR